MIEALYTLTKDKSPSRMGQWFEEASAIDKDFASVAVQALIDYMRDPDLLGKALMIHLSFSVEFILFGKSVFFEAFRGDLKDLLLCFACAQQREICSGEGGWDCQEGNLRDYISKIAYACIR